LTALIIVDVQNDFADPAGSLAVRDGAAVVPVLEAEIAAARAASSTVVYTQDWHPAHTPHFAQDGGIWPVHCVEETWGAALHRALTVDGPVIRKGAHGEDGYSGFTMRDPATGETVPTELEGMLRQRAVTRVVIGGLATDYCVRSTALDAVRLGFRTVVLTAAVRAVDLEAGDGDRALTELAGAGVTLDRSVRDIEAVPAARIARAAITARAEQHARGRPTSEAG
ncbi:MAG TPA: isochorismatase family protein, partial [Candidatus Dormibacteraeota bacterium]|nr:isochorismatase family protein [Candidatus Dormibacteraeota bacterium]